MTPISQFNSSYGHVSVTEAADLIPLLGGSWRDPGFGLVALTVDVVPAPVEEVEELCGGVVGLADLAAVAHSSVFTHVLTAKHNHSRIVDNPLAQRHLVKANS